jgi:hypothetical protein
LIGISHEVVQVREHEHEHVLDERGYQESGGCCAAYMQEEGDWIAERVRRHNGRVFVSQNPSGIIEELAGRV